MAYLGLGICMVLVVYLIYLQISETSRRNALTTKLRILLITLVEAESAFKSFTSYSWGYFENYKLRIWKDQYSAAFEAVKGLAYEATNLSSLEKATIQAFLDHYNRGDEIRQAYNKDFIPQELQRYDNIFSHIEGRSLDLQQRTAIISNEDNSLIVAGAGSGKTTTIIGKVKYVLDRYRTDPSNILLISFTSKSATTLADRIGIKGMQPRTFHKFGKDVICAVEQKQPSLYDESQFRAFISATFKKLMQDRAYAEKVTTYFIHHLKPVKSSEEFQNQGAYFQHLKDNNIRSYKSVEHWVKGKKTYKQEVVKSVEECQIANFLLFNGVEYQYEFPYEHPTSSPLYGQWKPDFTITQGDKKLYLEHFGVDHDGNVPSFFAKNGETREQASAKYQGKMAWARQTSNVYGTTLLESYSYEMQENTLFKNLAENLLQHSIVLQPKSPQEIWEIIANAAADEVDSFSTLLQTFIVLMKSNNYSIKDVRRQNDSIVNEHQKQRNLHFLDLITPIYERYEQELALRQELDFSDLITKATSYISSGAYRERFDYIIIDEFQDISQGRYHLIRALREQNPQCKLFCVGDDWQSIYRFAGSDMSLFQNFNKYFGYSLHSKIETTYRFHEPLIGVSSEFITKNPNQVRKSLKSGSIGNQTNYRIVYNTSQEQDDTDTVKQLLDQLISEVPGIAQKEIIVLGRYSFDLKRIRNNDRTFSIDSSSTIHYTYSNELGEALTLHIPFLTVHKAKGLEADIVILLNCSSGKFGFPSEMSDDPVLSLLLSEAEQFHNGEERRLFYVALTRAKEQVILVTNPAFKSQFITELEAHDDDPKRKKCPHCVTADALLRTGTKNGKPWAFYGCSNYLYGCDYQEWVRVAPPAEQQLPNSNSEAEERKALLKAKFKALIRASLASSAESDEPQDVL
ncbi:hypothetical protein D0N36_03665 [Hymenobacter lapidiphilus]|nr:hypothetical protein D0N36_03665 [Hymenobacter sp. CCM 8763]